MPLKRVTMAFGRKSGQAKAAAEAETDADADGDGSASAEAAAAEGDGSKARRAEASDGTDRHPSAIEEPVDMDSLMLAPEADDFHEDDDELEEELEESEEEIDVETEMEKLNANLKNLYPHLQDTTQIIADEAVELAVRARRNPMIKMNSKFVMPAPEHDWLGRRAVPPIICVSGFGGAGGNIGINGVYELHSDFRHDRPVYCKTLEKKFEADLDAHGPGVVRPKRNPLMNSEEWLYAKRSQTEFIVKAPPRRAGRVTMWPAGGEWFLFWDKEIGCWCIGPAVKHSEIYARCPGWDDLVPYPLKGWEVWDIGRKIWVEADGLRTYKGGQPRT